MSTRMADSVKAMNRRSRPHSNTISGGRPPALDITIPRPSYVRRNSEGSPRLPPPICISEPTPIEASANNNRFFNSEKIHSTAPSSTNSSRPSTPNSDNATPPSQAILKHSATVPLSGANLIDSPTPKRRGRSRGSSITSNLINEIKESSTLQRVASKIKSSRHSSEDVDVERNSFDGSSAPPSAIPSVAGTTDVYFANAKRNQDFHALFRSVPEEDSLIEDFGCALQKEILLQGRIYISESYLCFNANIFGWVTNLVIAFADIIEIEKKTTAYFIPNAIQISTNNAKHFFASFLSRDPAYDLMVEIWRIARPDLIPASERDEQDSVQCADGGSSDLSEEGSDSYYDSDTEDSYSDEGSVSDLEVAAGKQQSVTAAETKDTRKQSIASLATKKDTKNMDLAARRRAVSELPRPSFQIDDKASKSNSPANDSSTNSPPKTANGSAIATDKTSVVEITPQVHEKTECECGKNGSTEHYPNVVMNQVYNGSLEKIYNLLFHSEFIKKFFIEDQKLTELNMNEWKKGEGDVESVREMSYIKPLGGSIGPKSTKCIITEEVNHQDFEKYISVLTTTATPDVPSGGSFTCKTRTCLTWAGKGKVRMHVTVLVDFTKSSWLKSTIEKASIDGQQAYYKDLDVAMRAYFKEQPADGKSASRSEGRRRRKGKRSKRINSSETTEVKELKKEDKVDSSVHRVLNSISNVIADGITAVIDMICSPTASHLTLLCLITLVFVNIFIARKVAYVEEQLSNICQHHASFNEIVQEVQFNPATQQRREYNRQEEEDLWDWLAHIDPDKSTQLKEQVTYPDNSEEQETIWDEAIQVSKAAKERLDNHMIELSNMIQKAESNLEEVTKAVNEQHQKITQE